MSGLRGLLDDAAPLADKLHWVLTQAASGAADDESPQVEADISALSSLADDLVSRIDLQRHALRS